MVDYKRTSVEVGFFRRGVGHFEHKFQIEGASPTNHRWCQKLERLPFRVVTKYLQCIVWFCHKACVWQTDRITTP